MYVHMQICILHYIASKDRKQIRVSVFALRFDKLGAPAIQAKATSKPISEVVRLWLHLI